MLSSLYMVLGMERMHLRAVKDLPVVVVTIVCVDRSSIVAMGEERWMLEGPTRDARALASDWEPG